MRSPIETQLEPAILNPLTNLPPVAPRRCCKTCIGGVLFTVAGAGVQERCETCGFFVGWVEKFERKGKKKPATVGG